MPDAFYASPARRAALRSAAAQWLGTPFRANSRVMGAGGGVDCVRLAYSVHLAAGAFDPFEVGTLPLNWHRHHDESGILDFFGQEHVRDRLKMHDPEDPPAEGDLVTVRVGRCVHHLGTVVDLGGGPGLLHVPVGGEVAVWPLPLTTPGARVSGFWRILQ